MIRLAGIRRSFGPFRLQVDLEAAAGQYLVILGPSGCGKSLLLGTLAGLHAPAAGQVLIDGQDVTELPPERRGVGVVFQQPALFPHLDVSANIAFGLTVRGVPRGRRQQRVAQLVQLLGLDQLLERPTEALSGGEAQRVAIARALAPEPRVLLLDEPLSLLDHNARLELQAVLGELHRRLGLTVLHVTHNREEARALGERCAVMLGGRLVQVGPMEQVFGQPRCSFVAHFLGLGQTDLPSPDQLGCSAQCLAGTGRCDAAAQVSR